jgi:hypothetical protein
LWTSRISFLINAVNVDLGEKEKKRKRYGVEQEPER